MYVLSLMQLALKETSSIGSGLECELIVQRENEVVLFVGEVHGMPVAAAVTG